MKLITSILVLFFLIQMGFSQDIDIQKKLVDFENEMEKNLKDWNMPGVGVGVVKNGKLVYVKGFGYRDYEKKLPITANTLFQIASNTKLFTATSIGFLVNEGKLHWDKPIATFVPSIKFFNNDLNNSITIRDMLSHRTGITRHDLIWHKNNSITRTELFEKLKFLEPAQPLRQTFLYNNIMYTSAGHVINLIEGKTWEQYVQEKLLTPLKMNSTIFSIADMQKKIDYFVPYSEKKGTNILCRTEYTNENSALAPSGGIISNITDLSHWLAALMNEGVYEGKQVIPAAIVNATLEPCIAWPNPGLSQGFIEILNPIYGMGRYTQAYRGHQMVLHGGALNGIYSQISYMPKDSIGVIVFVIGNHCRPELNATVYNLYEHLLGLSITPWSERELKNRDARKKQQKDAREKAMVGQIKNTKPSHSQSEYLGDFENAAYGIINITQKDTAMMFTLHNIHLPLYHFHYDRFDTKDDDDDDDGFYSLNYQTNPQGDIDRFVISIDEGEVTFMKKADASLSTVENLTKYLGNYSVGTVTQNIVLKNKNQLFLLGIPDLELIPYKKNIFKTKEFADLTIEFIVENDIVKSMTQKDGSGEYEFKKDEIKK